ncbi:hypothetical protein CMI37_10475 [Candidatus Pacearchaeota archaeon]|nr:hypothetical protein [Candidatus Pacearchaeota archaeon]|tara:strand:- start:132 stop:758 length:627 start_codon:yes stop_codon:yes gene_type:complete
MAQIKNDMAEGVEDVDAEDEDVEDEDAGAEETPTDWEKRAKQLEKKGSKQREATKALKAEIAELKKANTPKEDEKPEAQTPASEETKGFNYAEKAYLLAKEIKENEFDFVREVMDATGKSLDDVLATGYFQKDLKERRDAAATKEATPSGSKRSGTASRDKVEYWIKKGVLPPTDQNKLRREVVKAKIAKAKSGSTFTDNPIGKVELR